MRVSGRRCFFVFARVALPTALVAAALALHSETQYLQALGGDHGEKFALAPASGVAAIPVASSETSSEHTVRPGQTLSVALQELGLDHRDSHAATTALTRYLDPRRLRPGDRYRAHFRTRSAAPGRELTGVEFAVAGRGEVRLARTENEWQSVWRPYTREVKTRTLIGEVTAGLETSIRAAGGQAGIAARMADVLQWDLDFNRDLRTGDRFEVLYEEVYLDGQPNGLGAVVALAYQTAGRRLEAYRYEDGYYDEDGRPLRKMFLKSPLPYLRVTSGFTNRRFHPVLKIYRPHLGVDLGAPTGTPVRVTASGSVVSAGWSGGGGKTVKVRHPSGYVTAYLHLSRYAKGMHAGARVRQGDVIGYVGSTGLATAPHLDYRVQRNGRWVNPMALGGVAAEPLGKAEAGSYRLWRDALRASLETGAPIPAGRGDQSQEATRLAAAPALDAAAGGSVARR
jgi:murein DD-endopeptidase MepM/ murein hydrolase activator NlpD